MPIRRSLRLYLEVLYPTKNEASRRTDFMFASASTSALCHDIVETRSVISLSRASEGTFMSQHISPQLLIDPDYKRLLQQCIHCGLCLPACPTYSVFGTEMDAPRGRIALMSAASNGRIGLG